MNDSSEMPPSQEVPQNSKAGPGNRYPLAGRFERLAATMLDNLIISLALVPIAFYFDVATILETESELPTNVRLTLTFSIFAAFLLINGYLLMQRGQTLGKKYMKIAIVDLDGNVPSFNRMIGLRYMPFWFMGVVPLLSLVPILEVLTIFREDRRCIHDMIARTKVIDVSIPR